MNNKDSSQTASTEIPTRIGVVFAHLGKLNVTALKYLIVHLNTLQRSIEFELLARDPNDPLLIALSHENLADRDKCRDMLSSFRDRIVQQFDRERKKYDLADDSLPANFVVVSLAKFSDEYYGLKGGRFTSRHSEIGSAAWLLPRFWNSLS
jgi:hypothetical protein